MGDSGRRGHDSRLRLIGGNPAALGTLGIASLHSLRVKPRIPRT